jgi:hypothetical protein
LSIVNIVHIYCNCYKESNCLIVLDLWTWFHSSGFGLSLTMQISEIIILCRLQQFFETLGFNWSCWLIDKSKQRSLFCLLNWS